MSANPLKETGANQTPQQALPGNGTLKNRRSDESAFVNLYSELTEQDESQARSTFMFVICDNEESNLQD
jgi:hypothetical protein